MNNDFVYKPPKKDSSNSSEPATGDTEDPAPEELDTDTSGSSSTDSSESVASDSTASGVVTSAKPRKGHGLLVFIVMLVLLLAAAAGVYYWQHQKVQDLQTSKNNLSAQVTSLQSQLAQKSKSSATMQSNDMPGMSSSSPMADVTDIVTVSPQTVGMDSALVSVMYSNKASETWVESGTAPDKLTTVAKHVKANGETDMQNFNLTGLEMGTRYYYRAAGMVNGKTVEGGIVSFMTTK